LIEKPPSGGFSFDPTTLTLPLGWQTYFASPSSMRGFDLKYLLRRRTQLGIDGSLIN